MYRYTLLKQDGTKTIIQHSPKATLEQFYDLLHCGTIELIPRDYWPDEFAKASTIYGDEEGRFNDSNTSNPHMKTLHDGLGRPYDIVGDVIVEEKE